MTRGARLWRKRVKRTIVGLALAWILLVAIVASTLHTRASASAMATSTSPVPGFTLHIDALKHFPGNATTVAHHWCRAAENGVTECLLFDSDAPNAQLVGVETVVPTATWKTYSPTEQALWHYHRVEIPKVSPTLPGLSPAEASKVVASLLETYGKIWILWDPSQGKAPIGQPTVYVLK
jgi:hypothetical protein